MGRNIHCTAEERIQIITLRGEGKSQREIAKIIGRELIAKLYVCPR